MLNKNALCLNKVSELIEVTFYTKVGTGSSSPYIYVNNVNQGRTSTSGVTIFVNSSDQVYIYSGSGILHIWEYDGCTVDIQGTNRCDLKFTSNKASITCSYAMPA